MEAGRGRTPRAPTACDWQGLSGPHCFGGTRLSCPLLRSSEPRASRSPKFGKKAVHRSQALRSGVESPASASIASCEVDVDKSPTGCRVRFVGTQSQVASTVSSFALAPSMKGGCGEGHDQRYHDSADRLRCLGAGRRCASCLSSGACEVVESTWRFPEVPSGASSALEVPGYRSEARCCPASL